MLQWARELDLPLIVALNKIDIASRKSVDKVRRDLGKAGIDNSPTSEQIIEISALKRIGLDKLQRTLAEIVDEVK